MMAYKTDGTIVIGRCVIMVMEYRHECGKQEKQYEKCSKAFMPIHIIHVEHRNRLIFADNFVKMLLILPHPAFFLFDSSEMSGVGPL
jgi:hypothetical protein